MWLSVWGKTNSGCFTCVVTNYLCFTILNLDTFLPDLAHCMSLDYILVDRRDFQFPMANCAIPFYPKNNQMLWSTFLEILKISGSLWQFNWFSLTTCFHICSFPNHYGGNFRPPNVHKLNGTQKIWIPLSCFLLPSFQNFPMQLPILHSKPQNYKIMFKAVDFIDKYVSNHQKNNLRHVSWKIFHIAPPYSLFQLIP